MKIPVGKNTVISWAEVHMLKRSRQWPKCMVESSKIRVLSFPSKASHVADLWWTTFGFQCCSMKKQIKKKKKSCLRKINNPHIRGMNSELWCPFPSLSRCLGSSRTATSLLYTLIVLEGEREQFPIWEWSESNCWWCSDVYNRRTVYWYPHPKEVSREPQRSEFTCSPQKDNLQRIPL